MTVHTVEKRITLNDMLGLFSKATSGACELDVSFPFDGTIICYPQSENAGDIRLHPLPTQEKSVRIRVKGELNRGEYDSLEIFLPYGTNCKLEVADMCEPDDRYPNGITITPSSRWRLPSKNPPPFVFNPPVDIKPNGTIWNDQGILILFYNEQHWLQWPL